MHSIVSLALYTGKLFITAPNLLYEVSKRSAHYFPCCHSCNLVRIFYGLVHSSTYLSNT